MVWLFWASPPGTANLMLEIILAVAISSVLSSVGGYLFGRHKPPVIMMSSYVDDEPVVVDVTDHDHRAGYATHDRGWSCLVCGQHVHRYIPRQNGTRSCVCGEVEA